VVNDVQVIYSHPEPVYFGGPVSGAVLLHTRKGFPKSQLCADGVYYTQFTQLNKKLVRQYSSSLKNVRVFLGYSEWYPGQLQSEIDKGWWFLARCPLSVLFPKKQRRKSRSVKKNNY